LPQTKLAIPWDALIETFNKNILAGTSYDSNSVLIADREKVVRFLAREHRLRRRMLADAFVGLIKKTKKNYRALRVLLPSASGEPYYCFLLMLRPDGVPSDRYRLIRGEHLDALCRVTKLMYPDALDIVGLATETGYDNRTRSEDAMYLDARAWNADDEAHARELQAELNILTNVRLSHARDWEFPTPDVPTSTSQGGQKPDKNPRNKPCFCGSGLKYKNCHGR
jgi:hypothetical protein